MNTGSRRKFSALALTAAVIAVGATAMFSDLPVRASAKAEDALSVMRSRAPGARAAGAQSSKVARAMVPLASRGVASAPPPRAVASLAPLSVAPAASAPYYGAAIPPVTGFAAPFATPLGAIPAAAPSGLFIPPIVLPLGGGGGGGTEIISVVGGGTPPPGGTVPPPGGTPTPVPGVPEPHVWLMMAIGFGVLGGLLRRQRRTAINGTGALKPSPALAA